MKKTIYEKIDFLESFLNTSLSKDGININIWCPFCKHSNKNKLKLVIHLEMNVYHCWLCDKKGSNVPYLISRLNNSKFEASKKYFGSKSNKENDLYSILKSFKLEEEVSLIEEQENIIDFPDDFKLLATNFNSTDPDVRDIFKYAVKRGFNKHKLWMLRVGYSNQNDFRRSIILPSLDEEGNINFYTSRKIDADTSDAFKYKNASIQKKNIVFNDINIDWRLPLTIVEGPLDLIKTNDNATCLLGSSLTEDMLLFKKIVSNRTPVNLALDSDVYYKTLSIASTLSSYDIDVKILDTRIANDVGDMSHQQFKQCLEESKPYSPQSKLLSKISAL